jgi:hypothetical protein
MKQKIYILGVVTAIIILVGTIFKVNHWPGAGYLLIIGLVTLVLVFLPLALTDHYKGAGNKQNLLLHIVTWLTCFVIFMGMLFKIQHWPGAGIWLTIALPFPYVVFLPVFLVTTSKNKSFNIYNTVFVLLLLAVNSVFSALLALNVTRERIHDSFNLSGNYNKVESVLNQLPVSDPQSPVNLKIDEVLKIVDEYQKLIFAKNGSTEDQWNSGKDILRWPDMRGLAAKALAESGESPYGSKLQNGMKELISLMGETPGYEKMAENAITIFDLDPPMEDEAVWPVWKFKDENNTWVLIYLDGLETNLKMIKVSAYN